MDVLRWAAQPQGRPMSTYKLYPASEPNQDTFHETRYIPLQAVKPLESILNLLSPFAVSAERNQAPPGSYAHLCLAPAAVASREMGVRGRKLAPLWALALTLACAQHTGQAQDGSVEHGHRSPDLPVPQELGGARIPAGHPLRGMTFLPPLRTAPVVRARNPAHNGRVCSAWGDFHYKTFDGDVFRFPGLCNYVFSAHCGAAYEDFNIQLRRGRASNATTVIGVTMKLDGMVVQLTKSSILVNGRPTQLPFSQSGVLIEFSSSYLKVVARLGLVFMWSQDDSLLLELDPKYANQTCGLCGDFSGQPVFNEFFSHGVKLTPIEFGNLQKMDGPTEQCQDPVLGPLRDCSPGTGICEEILSSWMFSGCRALVDARSYVQACRQDLCLCEHATHSSCICHTLAEYSRQCAHAGGQPLDWRGPHLCPQTCPLNMEYHECGSPCADTCSNLEHSQLCEDHCMAGCFCPEGMVLDDLGQAGCIPATQCSCVYNGAVYAPGASYATDCTNCTCSGGQWSCRELPCPGTCSVLGGPHFSTFDERQYTVHGDCSYVLAKPCKSSAFTVLAEVRRCGRTDTETCLRSLTLSLGGGHTVITVKAGGEVFVNQIYTQMPISAANVTLFRPSTFFIVAQTNLGLQLSIQLVPMMQVFVRLGPELRGLTCGLCGNFNQNQADDFRTLSGVVEGTAAAFANTWKTQAACPNVKNSFEDPCSLSVENEKYAQHWCSRLTDAHGPFARCHAAVNPGIYYSNCMFDTCNCEKSEDCLCAALSSYVHACTAKGVLLSGWRDGVCMKPTTTCPKSLTYHYHISTCQPTCRARSHEDVTCGISFVPVDGCTCPHGTFMDDAGKCVPATSCPCYHGGSVVPNGESLHERGVICTCTQGTMTCIGGQVPTPVCTPPMVYFDCRNATPGAAGASCQKSCFTLDMDCYSSQCEPGCVCPDGLVADGEGHCLTAADCPCVHNEASYPPGQTIRVGCNTCTCKNRMWQCTEDTCLATCAVYGDGHYLTFDGRRYSSSGDCGYTLVQDHCGGNGTANGTFRVVTENVPCGTTGVTCSKAIKLFLGSYELRLSDGGVEVIEKGVGQEVPYSIRQMGIYLVVDTEAGLVLLWDRKTSIFLKLSPEFKGRVCGLCGNFDDNAVNDFTTRSQSVVSSALEFSNSWKFSPSCPDAPAPRDPCTANPYRKSWAQKQCSIINSATFATCHAHVDPAKYYEACVGDACACDSGGDCECFCTAVAAYAQACHDMGVCVSWRTPDICPLFCDYYNPEGQCEWHYQPCGAPCMRTCRNPSGRCLHDLHGLEGCYPKCPPEAPIFDEDQMQCVAMCPTPPPPLPCRVQGKSYRPGMAVPSSKNCHSCVCTESGVQCAYDSEACVCIYDGRRFRPGDVIYHTTDGTGGCISAHCSASGTIERRVYACSSTTPTPPTTFSFSMSPLVVSSTPPSRMYHTYPKSRVHAGTTSGPTVQTLQACGEQCWWSPWLDVSHPGRGIDSGDFETLENLRAHGYQVCTVPKSVECQAEGAPGVQLQVLGQHVECSPTVGLTCYNRNQTSGLCHNYQIRILCCFPRTCPISTSPAQTTTPTASRNTEIGPTQGVSRIPSVPTESKTSPATVIATGSSTLSTTSETPAPGTPTPALGNTTPVTTTNTPGTTPAPGTTMITPGTTPAPVKTTLLTPSPMPVSTTREPCLQKLCRWTQWFDSSYPGLGINSGDFDTFPNLRSKGHKFCEKPSNVECRAKFFPNIPLEELGQDVICDKSVGLICLNKNQLPPFCYNYEIRIECCELVDVCRRIKHPVTSETTHSTPRETETKTQLTWTTGIPLSPTRHGSAISTPVHPTTSTIPETHLVSSTMTVTCQPQCTWTKWFDVDFPSPGPHGGDMESFSNIMRRGEKICRRPEYISQLECRAESHPEVSIENLGQVVQCNLSKGLVCRNRDQEGNVGMCLNYEIRVLCCEPPETCSTHKTVTVPHTPSVSPNSLTETTTTYLVTSQTSSTSVPTTSPTSVPTTSSTSLPPSSPTSVPTTSSTPVPPRSPISVPETSSTSVPTTSPTSVPTISSTPLNLCARNQLNHCATNQHKLCPNNKLNLCPNNQPNLRVRNQLNLCATKQHNLCPNNQLNLCPNSQLNLCRNNQQNHCANHQPDICARNQQIHWATNQSNLCARNQLNLCATNQHNLCPNNQLNLCPNSQLNLCHNNQQNHCANHQPDICARNQQNHCATNQHNLCARNQLDFCARNQLNLCTNNQPNLCPNNQLNPCLNLCATKQPNLCPNNQLNLCATKKPHLCARIQLNLCTNNQPNLCATKKPHLCLNLCATKQPNLCPNNQLNLCARNQLNHCATNQHKLCPNNKLNLCPNNQPNLRVRNQLNLCATKQHNLCPNNQLNLCARNQLNLCPNNQPNLCPNNQLNPSSSTSVATTRSTYVSPRSPISVPETSSTSVPTTSPNYVPETSKTTVPTTSLTSVPETSKTTVPPTSPTSVPETSSTSVPESSSTFVPTTSPTSVPTTSLTPVPETSSTSVPPSSPTSVPTTSSTSVPPRSPISVPETSSTSVPTSSPTSVPETSKPTVPTTSPTSVPKTSKTTVPPTSPTSVSETSSTSVPESSSTSVPTTSPTSVPTTSSTSVPPRSPISVPETSSTSVPTTSPNYVPENSKTTVPTTSPTSVPETTKTTVPTTSPTSVPETSKTTVPPSSPTSVPETSSTSVPESSSTSVPTTSPTSVPTTSSTSVPPRSPISVPETSSTSVPTTSPTSVPETSKTTVPTTSVTSVPETSKTTVPPTSPTSVPETSSTSLPESSSTSVPTTSPTSVPTTSSTPVPETSSTSVPPSSPTSVPTTRSTFVPTTSSTSVPGTSSSSVPTTSPSPVPETSSTSVPKSGTSSAPTTSTTPVLTPETTHSSHVTVTCQPQCTWTKWFDVDFPSPGPHGGDTETYCNIKKKGEKICRRPEYISQLECRAESHPEVSIENLGQVVQCNVSKGLVCRNRDQEGNVGMCLNYEVRVLCCERPEQCGHTSVKPHMTSPTKHSPAPESTSIVSTVPLLSSVAPSTTTCYCSVSGKLYPSGSIIYQQTDLAGHCYFAMCSLDCHVVRQMNQSCPSSVSPPAPTTSPHGSSLSAPVPVTKQGCPNAVPPRMKGETWPMPNCSQATCEGNGVISVHRRHCPHAQPPTCANGFPPAKVADLDGCCPGYQCQCVCSGWGDPHYITFDGTYYTFLGNCTYVLLQQIIPVYGHFRVLIDNYFCGPENGLSCPQAIIVEYRQDRVVLTRKPVLGVMTNEIIFNEKVVRPGFQKDGVSVSQIGIKMYVTIPELGVQVMFSGLIFSVEVPFSKFANNTEGQCGTCTNDKKDECRLPGGAVAAFCSDMSGHWKVTTPHQPLCHDHSLTPPAARPTPSPTACSSSSICQLILSKVFERCHAVIPPLTFYQGCVFDWCHKTNLRVVCSGLELYASLCASRGVCIDWRSHTNHACPFTCPADKVYQPCGPSKLSYCYGRDNTSLMALQDAGPITEGCFCPEDMMPFSTSSDVCVPIDCHKCLGPHGEPVEPGHTVHVDCQECTCGNSTLTLSCQRQPCPLPPACPVPGFVPVPAAPQADQCCPQYNCACDPSYCPKPMACPEGSRLILTYKEGACCPSQNCSWSVCSVNGTLYQPGSVVSSSLCETCRCEVPGRPLLDMAVISCETQICNTHCPVGFEYREQSGRCCGGCEPQACLLNTSDSSTHLFYPGQSWSDPGNPCVTHKCEKHRDGLVVVTRKKTCPPLSCPADQARPSADGCCVSCPPHGSQSSSTCTMFHESKVIRQRGCSSARPVPLAYCRGNCGDSASMYSQEANAMQHRCECCQGLRVSLRNVTLLCADGSSRAFSYPHVEECGCVGQRCGSHGTPGHVEGSGSMQSDEEETQEMELAGWRRGARATGPPGRLTSTRPRGSRPPPSGIH
ncbi:mucin-5AC [Zalophus californianus]|uniref:Mucin-5AC n=1 Tax=Zalophus californianus TaxID=9704 RepID=A0A6P9F0P6_ZALCA|nr:mucin-5AC [Zalophus californianus]